MTTETVHGVRQFTIHHDGVTLAVSRGGRGGPLVLCPGLSSTQDDLHALTALLRRDHDVVTFDLRGHGLSSAADRYTFAAFQRDLTAVMAAVARLDLSSAPLLVGYSLGADLAVHHAAAYPGSLAGLVVIDGANPVPDPFVTDETRTMLLAAWQEQATHQQTQPGSGRQVLLTGRQILDLNVEIDGVRSRILDQYRLIQRPVTAIMSTTMAGDSDAPHVLRLNENWRAGVDRLVHAQPHVATFRLDADHGLVATRTREIALIIRGTSALVDQED